MLLDIVETAEIKRSDTLLEHSRHLYSTSFPLSSPIDLNSWEKMLHLILYNAKGEMQA